MNRILFVIQLPPPVHGAAVANEMVVNSPLIGQNFASRHINISTTNRIEDIGKFSPAKVFSAALHLARIVKNMLSFRPDIVYLTLSPSGFAFYRDALYISAIRLFDARLVLHLHGKGIQDGARKSGLYNRLCNMIFKGSYVISLSDSLRFDVSSFKTKTSFVVNNGLPVSSSSSRQKLLPEINDPVELLYVSNYVQTKGVLDLIDALEVVAGMRSNFHCTLAGRPFDISIEFLTEYIKNKKLQDKFTVLGPAYGEVKLGLLEEADIFILPTYYANEAFPLSILEAMQFSLPVISTYEGGIPDIIDDGVNGLLFRQRDIEGLAEKIVFLLDHQAERIRIGQTARKKFLDRFTVSIFEQNMLRVFQQVSELEI